jgi:p-hydroxybenzoate 3-monooxygenase
MTRGIYNLVGAAPKIRRRNKEGHVDEITCDFIAGCDGPQGICRASIPPVT